MKRNYHVEFDLDFRRNTYKGLYIALEGIDGAGKTVQSERLLSYFQEKGADAMIINEPRRTGLIGRVINEFLQGRVKIPAASLQYLITADRIAELDELILPSLQKGGTLISHRCFWSAVPYGILDQTDGKVNYEKGNTIIVAQSILSMYFQVLVPDITFYLDIPPKVGLDRLSKMGGALEYYEKLDKLKKVARGYDWMIKKFPEEFTRIDGDREPEKITGDLIKIIENYKR
ncbi:MAG: dTMP kinase [Candidatus Levybacteria bacterium]|nr:dTMP kinase [Candidatus Levybacteria bacterium]